jgi:hypothetical protein
MRINVRLREVEKTQKMDENVLLGLRNNLEDCLTALWKQNSCLEDNSASLQQEPSLQEVERNMERTMGCFQGVGKNKKSGWDKLAEHRLETVGNQD